MATDHDTESQATALAACADLFASIASDAETLRQLLSEAASGAQNAAAIIVGGEAVAERIGLLAERASEECGRKARVQSSDEWSFDPRSVAALQVLAGAREVTHHG